MLSPPRSDVFAFSAAAQVLTDPSLWRLITPFQRGLPLPLYDFWVSHEPSIRDSKHLDLAGLGGRQLLELIAMRGTPRLLELVSQVQFYTYYDPQYRQPCSQMTIADASLYTIASNRIDMMQCIIANGWLLESPLKAMWERAFWSHQPGDLRVFEMLKTHAPIDPLAIRGLTSDINDIELVRWIDTNVPGSLTEWLLVRAASYGNAEIVAYLLDRHPTLDYSHIAVSNAYSDRHYPALRYMLEKKPELAADEFKDRMIRDGDKEVMQILREIRGLEHHVQRSVTNAIRNGHVDRLQSFLDEGLLAKDSPYSIDEVASWGKLDMVKFFHENGLATATTNAMDWAAENRTWDVVMYLHENRTEGCTTRVMDAAAKQEDLDRVRWLATNRTEGCSTRAMDEAASSGDLEMVRYLHENRSEGCTTEAMDHAACLGRLQVVKFLHENRSEGCTTNAIDFAADFGHLHVIKYLHANRKEGCTAAAVTFAARNGYPSIVRFLYEHYRSLFGPKLLPDLLLHGVFDIFLELRELYPEEAGKGIESVLFQAGKQMELRTIRFILQDLGRQDLAHLAVDGAATRNEFRTEDAHWLYAVMQIAGPKSCRLSAVRNVVASMSFEGGPLDLQYVISVCSEPGALKLARKLLKKSDNDDRYAIWDEFFSWKPTENEFKDVKLHAILLHPRVPAWASRTALFCDYSWIPLGFKTPSIDSRTHCRGLPELSTTETRPCWRSCWRCPRHHPIPTPKRLTQTTLHSHLKARVLLRSSWAIFLYYSGC